MSDNNSSSGVPAFLAKLWTLVDDPATDEFIAWDSTGDSFHVIDQSRFAKEILPLYFKHNNIASFIRQLNMYGFRKVVKIESGALKSERDNMQFSHQYFRRKQEYLLELIKRKVGGNKVALSTHGTEPTVAEDVREVLTEVHSIQDQQGQMNGRMDSLKIENEALWREVAMLRQKHMKQQQVVNKLVQFLVTLVSSGSQRTMPGIKRKKALMINSSGQLPTPAKKPRQISIAAQPPSGGRLQDDGPRMTILEMTDSSRLAEVEPTVTVTSPDYETICVESDPVPVVTQLQQPDLNPVADLSNIPLLQDEDYPIDLQPAEQVMAELAEPLNTAPTSLSLAPTVTSPTPGSSSVTSYRGDMEEYVDLLQSDLESLKDLLASNKYSLDANTLFGLFTPDAPLPATPDTNGFDALSACQLLNTVKSEGACGLSDPLLTGMLYNPSGAPAANTDTQLIQYHPLDISSLLSDADLMTDLTDDPDVSMAINDNLTTPTLEVKSVLAKRRQSRRSDSEVVTSEEID